MTTKIQYPKKPSECAQQHRINMDDGFPVLMIFYSMRPHWMTFFAFDTAGVQEDGTVLYGEDSSSIQSDPDLAQPLIAGSLKWDGCMDCDIGGDGMSYRNHFCGKEDALQLAQVIETLYTIAQEQMEGFDKELSA